MKNLLIILQLVAFSCRIQRTQMNYLDIETGGMITAEFCLLFTEAGSCYDLLLHHTDEMFFIN